MSNLPIRGWPEQVIIKLKDLVSRMITRDEVKGFSFGWTHDPMNIKAALRPDDLVVVYQTERRDHAHDVRECLAIIFSANPKFIDDTHLCGDTTINGPDIFVYIAIWYTKQKR